MFAAFSGTAATFAKTGLQIGFGGEERGSEAESGTGEKREKERESENEIIDADRVELWNASRKKSDERAHAKIGKGNTDEAAKQAEHRGLAEKLTNDARAAGSQSGAYGDFAGARSGAGEQQIGDVGAGNQEHEADRA